MKIESPFGPMELVFHRNNSCTLQSRGMEHITINGVEVNFHFMAAILENGNWELAAYDSQGKFYKNSSLNLRYSDWRRNGTPSISAYQKLRQWIEAFFLPDLNRGTYTQEQKDAERNYVQREINERKAKISEINKEIAKMQGEIDNLLITLSTLP